MVFLYKEAEERFRKKQILLHSDLRNRHSMTLRASWEGQQGWSGGRKLEHKGRCRPEPVLRFPSERQGRTGGNSLGLVGLNNFSRL